MRRALYLVLVGHIALVMAWSRPAHACSPPWFEPHQVNAAAPKTDWQPPTLDATTRVKRGVANEGGCDGTARSSCDGSGVVIIDVAARDDQTPAAHMGYRLRVIAGTPPHNLYVPFEDVRAPSKVLYLTFGDGDPASAFSFTLTVAPIDAAGNVGAAVTLDIGDAGSVGGCGFAPTLPGAAPRATGLAFVLLALRRWRSRRRDCL